jgi:phage terminase small subunit
MTAKQERFCHEYIIVSNATQAAIKAGYSKRSAQEQGSYLLSNPIIKEKVEQLKSAQQSKLKEAAFVNEEMIMRELKAIGFSNVQDFVTYDDDGVALVSSENLTREKLAAVKSVKIKKRGNNKETEFELYDKAGALVKMGEQIGMFKKNMQLTGANGEPLFAATNDVELDSHIKRLMGIAKDEEVNKPAETPIVGFIEQTETGEAGDVEKIEDI